MELIYGAGKLDRRVEGVEDLLSEWQLREAEWGELYLEFEPSTPPDALLVEDLAATMLINSRVAGQAAAAVLRHGHTLDLASTPDAPLEETTADERQRLAELIGTMTSWPWFGASLATKTLHKKRPRLIPILDNQAVLDAAANRFFRDAPPRATELAAKNLGGGRVLFQYAVPASDPAAAGQVKVFVAEVNLTARTLTRLRYTRFADGSTGEVRGPFQSTRLLP